VFLAKAVRPLAAALARSVYLDVAKASSDLTHLKHFSGGTSMDWRERIVCDPEILRGKPTIKGTRISVELVLGWLATGWTVDQFLENYPHVQRDDVLAALSYASEFMREERFIRLPEAA
jgi:uncharacterized protein (DUF433 family)